MKMSNDECTLKLLTRAIEEGFEINYDYNLNDILGEAKKYIFLNCEIDKYDECDYSCDTVTYSDDYASDDYVAFGEFEKTPYLRDYKNNTFTKISYYDAYQYEEKGENIYWFVDVMVNSIGEVIQLYFIN